MPASGPRCWQSDRDPGKTIESVEIRPPLPRIRPAMKTRSLVVGVWLAVSTSALWAEAPDTNGSGWKPLFAADYSDAEKPDGVWTVVDGALTASQDQAIWTKGEHENFLLDLEFKNAAGTNSGVILYCTDVKNWIPKSVEIQIADDFAEKWAKAAPNWHCAAVFGHVTPKAGLVKKPGEWNRMTIEAKGQHVKVWLNGELASEMDMSKWTSAKKNPDGSEIPPWLSTPLAEMPTKGRIGFQGKHGDATIWFRNIRIKSLGGS